MNRVPEKSDGWGEMEEYYRITVGKEGIYEAVEKYCPNNDIRRKKKPDGSWLKKAGINYPRAISFWTKTGVKRYIESGLLQWHSSVVRGKPNVSITEKPDKILYQDKNQIICNPEGIVVKETLPLKKFLQNLK